MQLEIYNNFLKDFQDEEKSLTQEINFAEKQKDLEKREREEFKKLEKVFRKDHQEVEDIFTDTSLSSAAKLKAMKDKIMKTINEINKVQKQTTKAKE